MKRLFVRVIIFLLVVSAISCNKKSEITPEINASTEFSWKSELKISDVPNFPVKGFINGKEIAVDYINFERWRGSGDNIINFGDVRPKNNCGYVESDNSFHLLYKAGEIKAGELLKSSFDQNLDGFVSYYQTAGQDANDIKSVPWNCAMEITSMDEKTVKGKIALCFKDDKKSWIAGSFEAIRCNN